MGNFILTRSGARISPDEGAPTIRDIAIQLGRIPRFVGATATFYPVLAHSMLVAEYVPPGMEIHALLHDAGEIVTGDIPTPYKLVENNATERKVRTRIYESLGIRMPNINEIAHVARADNMALVAEARVLGPKGITSLDEFSKSLSVEMESHVKVLASYPAEDWLTEDGDAVRYFIDRVSALVAKEMERGARFEPQQISYQEEIGEVCPQRWK